MNIINSTISGNSSVELDNGGAVGGGIHNGIGTLNVTNSTISNNSVIGDVSGGGAIFNTGDFSSRGGTVTVTNSTICNNTSSHLGGGIQNNWTLNLRNSIVADNSATIYPDIAFKLNSQGHNLIENITGIWDTPAATDITGFDPKLSPLQNNGGSTFTHALLPNSPAINAGSNALAVDFNNQPLSTDQRGTGFPRIINGRVDMGAFEALAQRRPLIFIPGILGSRLARASNDSELWPLATSHVGLTLDPDDPARIEDIVPTGTIRSVTAFGITSQFYGPLLDSLVSAGYQIDGDARDLFVFAYDWRKSNAENAINLRNRIESVRSLHSGSDVDIVAHSMG
jgi:hypothetical protein